MFKVGDKVARRGSPNILLGCINEISAPTVPANRRAATVNGVYYWADDGSTSRSTSRNTLKDIVPFVEAGEKKFYVVQKLQTNGSYGDLTLEQAQAKAVELAGADDGTYVVFEAVSKHERPTPVVSTSLR